MNDFFIGFTGAFAGTAVALCLMLLISIGSIQHEFDDRLAKFDSAATIVLEKVESVGDKAVNTINEISKKIKDTSILTR